MTIRNVKKRGYKVRQKVTEAYIEKCRDAVMQGLMARSTDGRFRVFDDQQPGLQFVFYKTGDITCHAGYAINASRPLAKIGDYGDNMNLQEARHITKLVRELGDRGIDVQDSYLPRLIRELKRDGLKWRPWEGYEPHDS